MLRSLLSAQGVNPQMITVFIDGYYEVRALPEVPVAWSLVPQLRVYGAAQSLVGGRLRAPSPFLFLWVTAPHPLLCKVSQLSQAMDVDKASLAFTKAWG